MNTLRFPTPLGGVLLLATFLAGSVPVWASEEAADLPVVALTTVFRQNSHAQVIAGRLFLTHDLEGTGRVSPLKLKRFYVDHPEFEGDLSAVLSERFSIPRTTDLSEAFLPFPDGKPWAGALLIAEHGPYDRLEINRQIDYPKRPFFDAALEAMAKSGEVWPLFLDKHIGNTYEESLYIVEVAKAMDIPLMAGSSVPVTTRSPDILPTNTAPLRELMVLTYHRTESYGIHALEALQFLAEQRPGGETGIVAIRLVRGPEVWEAVTAGEIPGDVLQAALAAQPNRRRPNSPLSESVRDPQWLEIRYRDGTRGHVLTLSGTVNEWTAAWKQGVAGREKVEAVLFEMDRWPFTHFSHQLTVIEEFFRTGTPPWPIERNLYTSALFDFWLRLGDGGIRLTPELEEGYAVGP